MNHLSNWQHTLASKTATERIEWALELFPNRVIATSSFGIQSAVALQLVTQVAPDIPIVFIDTGYLFRETYQYAKKLTERMDINLHCYCPRITPAHREAIHGREWEEGESGLNAYLEACKIEPMRRALAELQPKLWLSGLRRAQSDTRQDKCVLEEVDGILKLYPIIDWSNQAVNQFMQKHRLPRHPLESEGFVSVGDWHSTTKLGKGMREQDTRFSGLKRECGLHENIKWKGASE
jgi:phosphoadenosine phosphosulfate reductase